VSSRLGIPQLGRILPLQVNVKTEQHTKVVYQTIEEARAELIANRIDPDVLERAMMPPFPTEAGEDAVTISAQRVE
jgi:hypothetical protein